MDVDIIALGSETNLSRLPTRERYISPWKMGCIFLKTQMVAINKSSFLFFGNHRPCMKHLFKDIWYYPEWQCLKVQPLLKVLWRTLDLWIFSSFIILTCLDCSIWPLPLPIFIFIIISLVPSFEYLLIYLPVCTCQSALGTQLLREIQDDHSLDYWITMCRHQHNYIKREICLKM